MRVSAWGTLGILKVLRKLMWWFSAFLHTSRNPRRRAAVSVRLRFPGKSSEAMVNTCRQEMGNCDDDVPC